MFTWLNVSYSNGRVSGMEGETTSDSPRTINSLASEMNPIEFKKGPAMIERNTKPPKHDAPVLQLTLRAKEVARALSLSDHKVSKLTTRNRLPHFHVGKAVLYPVDEIRQWIKDQTKKKGGN